MYSYSIEVSLVFQKTVRLSIVTILMTTSLSKTKTNRYQAKYSNDI